jgi:spermidine synthase
MNHYFLLSIFLITLFIYLLSYVAVKLDMLTKDIQRKLWNTFLLVTFLTTAILGLLLSVQVIYKLELPYVKQILIWHVNFGITMSIVALFHVCWHFKYYSFLIRRPSNKKVQKQVSKKVEAVSKTKSVYLYLFVLGFCSSIVQVIMLRECMNVFYSNELVIGLILALWVALTGIGAWTAKGKQSKTGHSINLAVRFGLLAILPVITILLLNYLKNIIFPPGLLIGFWQLAGILILMLSPFCLISGNTFALLSSQYSAETGSKLYAFESIGSVLGGIVVSIVMVFWLNITQSLFVIFSIGMFVVFHIMYRIQKSYSYVFIAIGVFALSLAFVFDLDKQLRQFLYVNQQVVQTKETPYGNLTITETAGQYNVFENLSLLFSSDNTVLNEEMAHFPMLQFQNPQRVLLISGGISGIAKEILKYPSVSELVYIEPNPWLLKHTSKYFKLPDDKKLTVIDSDSRNFIKNDNKKFDVIIIALPEPSTLQVNRFYTLEFFEMLKKHTNAGAVISLSLNSSANYLSNENISLYSVMYNTLKKVFTNVLVLPGEKDYFLASDESLNSNIGRMSENKNIMNNYVNFGYIDDASMYERSRDIQKEILRNAPVNTDFKPSATYLQSAFFFTKLNINSLWVIVIAVALFFIPLFKLNSLSFSIYTTGFTASVIEMLVIVCFQVMFGYVYAASGVVFAVFMAGLAIGAYLGAINKKIHQCNQVVILQLILLLVALFAILFLYILGIQKSNVIAISVMFVLNFIPSIITGYQFSTVLKVSEKSNKGRIGYYYGADLFGSALGLFIAASFLIPMLGMYCTVGVLLVINLLAIAILLVSKKNYL